RAMTAACRTAGDEMAPEGWRDPWYTLARSRHSCRGSDANTSRWLPAHPLRGKGGGGILVASELVPAMPRAARAVLPERRPRTCTGNGADADRPHPLTRAGTGPV